MNMAKRSNGKGTEHVNTIVIGGGQAGLATGYHLKKQGREFVILEGHDRVGDSWRKRWDSLRIFTPAKFSGLPGMRIPGPRFGFPTKDEMGDYLERYASTFEMDVRTGVHVECLSKDGDTFVVTTSDGRRFEADNVVVATGSERTAKTPDFASTLGRDIVQLHSSEYESPAQLQNGSVLVVGCGNSGAEIGYEVSKTHTTYVSGKPSAQIPAKHGPMMARTIFRVIRFMGLHVLNLRTPIGRKIQPKFIKTAAPLIRVKTKDLAKQGAELVGRTAGISDGRPVLDDGRVLDVANVIWCTGFREEWPWIDIPVFGIDGRPVQYRGVATDAPGLYFVGVRFQYAAASDVLPGVGRDAEHVAKHIAARMKTTGRVARATASA
jgi:putative flavoprotein involved in K+ transport